MKRIRVSELKVGDEIALSDGSVIVGHTTITSIIIPDNMPNHRLITLDKRRSVLQHGDDKVTVITGHMEMRKDEDDE